MGRLAVVSLWIIVPVVLSCFLWSPYLASCPVPVYCIVAIGSLRSLSLFSQRPFHLTPNSIMLFKTLVPALAVQLAAAQELMRFGCSQLVVDQIDPLVEPGNVPSAHMHQIVGGNSFNASMAPVAYDPSTTSSCTSCTYSEDFSNYWTANLYFKARNGTFKRVPQVSNLGLNVQAGVTVYYIRGYTSSAKVTAFPPVGFLLSGFRSFFVNA